MSAKDLAKAKTPARSNVTTTATTTMHHHRRHQYDSNNNNTMTDEMGRYVDYVHDPNYTFVRTPTIIITMLEMMRYIMPITYTRTRPPRPSLPVGASAVAK